MASADIRNRITKEREAINKSNSHIAELTDKRVHELEAGNDARVDEIEAEIRSAESAIARGEERLVLLEQRLADAEAEERETELDALAARAAHARKIGERLIRQDYTKAAEGVVAVLNKLKAVDDYVATISYQLRKAGRESIDTSNAIRCRARQVIERTGKETIGVGDPRHPEYANVEMSSDGHSCRHRVTKEPIARFAEFDVSHREVIEGFGQDPLQDAVRLPGVATDGTCYWPPPKAEDTAALLKQLGIGETAGVIGKLKQIVASKAA